MKRKLSLFLLLLTAMVFLFTKKFYGQATDTTWHPGVGGGTIYNINHVEVGDGLTVQGSVMADTVKATKMVADTLKITRIMPVDGDSIISFGRHTTNYNINTNNISWTTSANPKGFSIGNGTIFNPISASGLNAIAVGFSSRALATYSMAFGNSATSSGINSTAIGISANASADSAMAMGYNTAASSKYSVALGNNVSAGGIQSLALGSSNTSTAGNGAIALGNNAYSGSTNSIAIGNSSAAVGNSSIVVGTYVSTNASNAFCVGTGASSGSQLSNTTSNSLMVGFNSNIPTLFVGPSSGTGTIGNVGIGTSSPAARLEINGSSGSTIKIVDGNQAAGKVLTSDANGQGSWQTIGSGANWTLTGNSGTTAGTNYIGTNDNVDFVVKTNNTEKMRVLAGGNVGIGTSSPSTKLNVALSTGATPSDGIRLDGQNSGYVELTNNTSASNEYLPMIRAAASNGMTATGTPGLYIQAQPATDNANNPSVIIRAKAPSSNAATTASPVLQVRNWTTDLVIIDYSGKLGIGTTTPVSKLDVEGGMSVGNTYSGTTAAPSNGAIIEGQVAIGASTPLQAANTGSPSKLTVAAVTDNTVFMLKEYANTTALPKLTLAKSRGTSIGSEVATSNNDYFGALIFEGVNTSNATAVGAQIVVKQDGSGGATYIPSRFEFYTGTSSTTPAERMRITSAGDVGIGTTSPSYKLDVSGDARVTGIMGIGIAPNASYALKINGDGFSSGSWLTSDQQFKTEIDSLQNALATIKQLKPKTYYFDTANVYGLNFSNKKQYGFLAQDIEQVLPELVKASNKDADIDTLGNIIHPAIDFKAINYVELIAILTKGIQELQQKNDSLQTKANNQESINNILQNQVNQLEVKSNNQDVVNTSLQNQFNELQASINNCCNATRSMHIGSTDTQLQLSQMDVKLNDIQSIVLEQNVPNPFAEQTTINYILPDNITKAQMLFYNSNGKLIQAIELLQKGKGQLNVFASDLSSGVYTYTLVVDGKIVESKKMIKQ